MKRGVRRSGAAATTIVSWDDLLPLLRRYGGPITPSRSWADLCRCCRYGDPITPSRSWADLLPLLRRYGDPITPSRSWADLLPLLRRYGDPITPSRSWADLCRCCAATASRSG